MTTNRVALGGDWLPWSRLADAGDERFAAAADGPLAAIAEAPDDPWAALAASARTGRELLIAGADRFDDALAELLRASGYVIWRADGITEPTAPRAPERGRITVLSSGTTGRPKLVPHTLDSLATMRRLEGLPPRRWLCPYAPGTYAWYQCAVLGLTVPGQDVVPVAPGDATGWVDAAVATRVDAISATPTFWRRTFLLVDPTRLETLPLAQISLGGEPVDQPLLDRLRRLFPAARLTHIYASSEAGAAIAVSDGRAGFPRAWLDEPRPNGVEIRLEGARLLLRSPWANVGDGDAWIDTGDMVHVDGDRVVVVGRASGEVINVGGAKVAAEDVAAVLAAHPAVAWCRVRPKRAPIVGELVVAEVALAQNASAAEDELIAWCGERLPEVAVPRLVRFVDDVPATAALKAAT